MDVKFSAMFEADVKGDRPSIAPEKLMRAMLLQVLYSIRSERQLVEWNSYNLLFRWFIGLSIEDAVWNHSVSSKNRDRLIEFDAVTDLFNTTVETAQKRGLLSSERFSVDGTPIQVRASHKGICRKDDSDDGRPPGNWHGETRSNETHDSKNDGDSRLYRKSNVAPALPRSCADRQSARFGRQCPGRSSEWASRTRSLRRNVAGRCRFESAHHSRRGQGL